VKIEQVERVIEYNGKPLADLNPSASVDDVIRMHAATIPKLATANVEGPVFKNGKQVYTVNTNVGYKG
jgi:PRTRC genetic system protein C